jgi:hypothetical protein
MQNIFHHQVASFRNPIALGSLYGCSAIAETKKDLVEAV